MMSRKKKTLITIFLILFGYSMVVLGNYLLDFYRSTVRIDELERLMEEQAAVPDSSVTSPESVMSASPEAAEPVMLPEFKELYAQNSDIIGWLKIEGSLISYPVMHTPLNAEFYLSRDFNRQESKSGLPFLDYRCSIDKPTTNWIIYGHNMKNGSMFHALMNYKNEAYYKEHPVIKLDTLYEQGEYEIIAVILSKVYRKDEDVFKFYQFVNAETQTEFDSFIQNVKQLALYDTGLSAQYGDQLLTLTTCEYSTENGRLAVIARRI